MNFTPEGTKMANAYKTPNLQTDQMNPKTMKSMCYTLLVKSPFYGGFMEHGNYNSLF